MMVLALLPLGWAGWLGVHDANWWPLALILLMSLLTLATYAWDKRQAIRGGWRVPETRLHLLELCGGPGGPPVAAPQDPEGELPPAVLGHCLGAITAARALARPPALAGDLNHQGGHCRPWPGMRKRKTGS